MMYAAELKKRFRCYGHFYRLAVEGREPLLCRSVLEITSLPRHRVDPGKKPETLFDAAQKDPSLPEAVVIMMNPGSSRPIEPGATDRLLTLPPSDPACKPLVLTRPDNTQYQIMRIMVHKEWNHVRVLNLSDLRESKSPVFTSLIQSLPDRPGGSHHSLFCDARSAERTAMLQCRPGAPYILGWGQNPGLIPLAEMCLRCIEGASTAAVPSPIHSTLTAHPSPMLQKKKELWVHAVLEALE